MALHLSKKKFLVNRWQAQYGQKFVFSLDFVGGNNKQETTEQQMTTVTNYWLLYLALSFTKFSYYIARAMSVCVIIVWMEIWCDLNFRLRRRLCRAGSCTFAPPPRWSRAHCCLLNLLEFQVLTTLRDVWKMPFSPYES